jgi:hypothetical protein
MSDGESIIVRCTSNNDRISSNVTNQIDSSMAGQQQRALDVNR